MTFDQLVKDAQPSLIIANAEVTEGRSWEFNFAIIDSAEDPVSLVGCTVLARVLDDIDGAVLLTFTSTISGVDNNQISITATPAATSGIGGVKKTPRACPWHLTLTNGAGRKLDLWGAQESRLIIMQEG